MSLEPRSFVLAVQEATSATEMHDKDAYILGGYPSAPLLQVNVQDKKGLLYPIAANCDTGAGISLASKEAAKRRHWIMDTTSPRPQIEAANGKPIETLGICWVDIVEGQRRVPVMFIIVPEIRGSECILCWRTLQELGVISREFPLPQSKLYQTDHG